jgi:hypothetical protein
MQALERDDLEEDRAERIDVGALVRVDRVADLLRRHVPGRPENVPVKGLHADGRVGREHLGLGHDLGDAPVEHVDLAEVADHHVRGLEIAVHDPARMRVVDRHAHVPEHAEELGERPLADGFGLAADQREQQRLERLPGDALHGEEVVAVLVEADVVHGDDRGVLEAALHAHLAKEPGARLGRLRQHRAEHLEGDLATDRAVGDETHLAHAAAAEHAPRGIAWPCGQGCGRPVRGALGHPSRHRPRLLLRAFARVVGAVLERIGHVSSTGRFFATLQSTTRAAMHQPRSLLRERDRRHFPGRGRLRRHFSGRGRLRRHFPGRGRLRRH